MGCSRAETVWVGPESRLSSRLIDLLVVIGRNRVLALASLDGQDDWVSWKFAGCALEGVANDKEDKKDARGDGESYDISGHVAL